MSNEDYSEASCPKFLNTPAGEESKNGLLSLFCSLGYKPRIKAIINIVGITPQRHIGIKKIIKMKFIF
jgi:hypothetical protein